MGAYDFKRSFFNVEIDKNYKVNTKKVATISGKIVSPYRISQKTTTKIVSEKEWDIQNREELKKLFAEIQKAGSYENTFGYDLLSVALFCTAVLVKISLRAPLPVLVVPLALTVQLAILAVTLPPTLTLIALEHLIINPLKWVIDAITPSPHADFINQVMGEERAPSM